MAFSLCAVKRFNNPPSIQVAIDGTALTGRLSTRQIPEVSEDYRVVYGLHLETHTLPLINLVKNSTIKESLTVARDKKTIVVNGLPCVKG